MFEVLGIIGIRKILGMIPFGKAIMWYWPIINI